MDATKQKLWLQQEQDLTFASHSRRLFASDMTPSDRTLGLLLMGLS